MSYKIYSWHGNPRGDICRIAAEFAKVDYEFVNTPFSELKKEEFLAKYPLGKVPILETPEGTLSQAHAILKFFGRKAGLVGTNNFEEAQANQWLDWVNSDLIPHALPVYAQNIGLMPFDEAKYKESRAALFTKLKQLNDFLAHNTFLAGEQVSVADIAIIAWVAPLFWTVLDEGFRKGHFSLVRWYKHTLSYAPIKKFLRAPFMCKNAWISVKAEKAPAKKDKAPAKKAEPKKAAEPKKVEAAPAKPAKNPLEVLPESSFKLFDFKTYIVNEKDRKKGVQEFFKQYDAEGYSIWHVKYDKYEGEGVKLFLTSNMKDSFLQRLDHFRKYVFGTYGVYGDEGNYDVQGIWVWRGTGIPQEILDLPNYEYHFWTKLDHTKEEDRARLEAYWTGLDNDVSVVEGQTARDVHYFK